MSKLTTEGLLEVYRTRTSFCVLPSKVEERPPCFSDNVVHIWLYNSKGQVFLAHGEALDVAVTEKIIVDEQPGIAAMRGLADRLQLIASIRNFQAVRRAQYPDHAEFVYLCRYDGNFPPGLQAIPIDILASELANPATMGKYAPREDGYYSEVVPALARAIDKAKIQRKLAA